MAPYREPAKPKKKKPMKLKDRLYYVTICHYGKEKKNAGKSVFTRKWLRATDGYKALEKFRNELKIKEHNIWATEVLSIIDFINKDNEIE